jgi:hypothetical protein
MVSGFVPLAGLIINTAVLTKAKDAGFLTNDTTSIKDEPLMISKPTVNSCGSYLKSFWKTQNFLTEGDCL